MSDVTFDMRQNSMEVHHKKAEPWEVTLVDTGENSMTGGRLKRVRDYVLMKHFVSPTAMVLLMSILQFINHHKTHRRFQRLRPFSPLAGMVLCNQ